MRKIAAHYIFTCEGEPIKNGYVLLDDDMTVIETGRLENECESTEFYNGIIVPGFVNCHCHSELSHLKGHFRQDSGMAGFIQQINELRLNSSKEERIAAASEQFDIMYRQGISAMADISNCNETFGIKSESPLYTRTFLEVFGTEKKDVESIMDEVEKLNAEAASYGIDAAPTPHACYTSSAELLQTVSRRGLESGFLSYHSEESWQEQELVKNGTGPLADEYNGRGLSTPEVCGRNSLVYYIDLLKDGYTVPQDSHILLVHNTFTDEESIDKALAELPGTYWAICPKSNIFIHRALPPLELMRRKGLRITVGTDSLSSNTSLDFVEELYTIQEHFPSVPLAEMLVWATANGAEFLRKDDMYGTITPGKKPGIVLVENMDLENMKLRKDSRSRRLA